MQGAILLRRLLPSQLLKLNYRSSNIEVFMIEKNPHLQVQQAPDCCAP